MKSLGDLDGQPARSFAFGVNSDGSAIVGRAVALCVHPYAAWRLRPGATRVLLVSAYAAAAYAAVLGVCLRRFCSSVSQG